METCTPYTATTTTYSTASHEFRKNMVRTLQDQQITVQHGHLSLELRRQQWCPRRGLVRNRHPTNFIGAREPPGHLPRHRTMARLLQPEPASHDPAKQLDPGCRLGYNTPRRSL